MLLVEKYQFSFFYDSHRRTDRPTDRGGECGSPSSMAVRGPGIPWCAPARNMTGFWQRSKKEDVCHAVMTSGPDDVRTCPLIFPINSNFPMIFFANLRKHEITACGCCAPGGTRRLCRCEKLCLVLTLAVNYRFVFSDPDQF